MREVPIVLASLAILSLGCSDSTGPSGPALRRQPQATTTLHVAPSSATLQAGETVQLTARFSTAALTSGSSGIVGWSSSNEHVATVTPTGVVLAHSAGQAVIFAVSGAYRASAQIRVVGPWKKHDSEPVCLKRIPRADRALTHGC